MHIYRYTRRHTGTETDVHAETAETLRRRDTEAYRGRYAHLHRYTQFGHA